jgi:hypothetical protein
MQPHLGVGVVDILFPVEVLVSVGSVVVDVS